IPACSTHNEQAGMRVLPKMNRSFAALRRDACSTYKTDPSRPSGGMRVLPTMKRSFAALRRDACSTPPTSRNACSTHNEQAGMRVLPKKQAGMRVLPRMKRSFAQLWRDACSTNSAQQKKALAEARALYLSKSYQAAEITRTEE
ncbi:MAG: hypothetical protein ACPGWR_23705, partial [Ardenticatenaceae bacterium]